jgi:DNA-binding MarR family transcriptional regulator
MKNMHARFFLDNELKKYLHLPVFLSAKYIYNNHPLSIVREDMAEWLSMKRALVDA